MTQADRYSARRQRDEAVEDAKHARARLAQRREALQARNRDLSEAELAELNGCRSPERQPGWTRPAGGPRRTLAQRPRPEEARARLLPW